MNSKKAEALLTKYWAGKTDLEEEKQLKSYFSNLDGTVDQESVYFDFLEKNHSKKIPDQFDEELLNQISEAEEDTNTKSIFLRYWHIAASVILIVSISIIFKNEIFKSDAPAQVAQVDTFEDPERAFEETKKALLFISSRLNQGGEYASQLSKFEQSQEILKQN